MNELSQQVLPSTFVRVYAGLGLVTIEILRGHEIGRKGALNGEALFYVVAEVAGMFSVIVAGIRDLFMTAAP